MQILKYLYSLWKIYFIRRVAYLYRHYNILRSGPRRCLEYRYLPYVRAKDEYQNILLVGVASCTAHYGDYFNNKKLVVSIDMNPEKAKHGVKGNHIIDSIEAIDKYFKEGSIDCIFFNGVYGWGLDGKEETRNSVEKMRKILRKDGLFIFGFDKVPKHDPIDLDGKDFFKGFEPFSILGKSEIYIHNKHNHIYRTYKKA